MSQRTKEIVQCRWISQPQWRTPIFYQSPSVNRNTTHHPSLLPFQLRGK
jgi:hypothetical protein